MPPGRFVVVGAARKGRAMPSKFVRWGGLAALLGGLLGIVLTPVLAYLWAANSDAYGYYGRAYFLVFLGCLVGMAGLYALRRVKPGQQATEKPDEVTLSVVMSIVGLAAALVGSVLDYWGGTPGQDFTQVQIRGFALETVGLLLVLLGSTLLGLQYRRANVVPAFVAWLLIAAGPGGVVLSFLVHLPSGTMLLFCCAWVVLGYLLFAGRVAASTGHRPRAR